jgi:hypothetical protein
MRAVMNAERALGHDVIDVSAEKCGWDVTSLPKALDGKLPPSRHIEVKGRAKGQTTITVTRNEILYGLNQTDKFILAVVMVDGEQHEGPFYVRQPFTQEPDWAVTSINLDLDQLLASRRSVRHGGMPSSVNYMTTGQETRGWRRTFADTARPFAPRHRIG